MNVHENIASSLEKLAAGLKESLAGLEGEIVPAEIKAKATPQEQVLINRINIAFKEAIKTSDMTALENIQKEITALTTKIKER